MRRRRFLISLSAFLTGTTFSAGLAFNSAGFEHWVWVHADCQKSDEEWRNTFRRFKKAGISAILLNVYTGRDQWFHADLFATKHCDLLQRLLPIAAEFDLPVHAWMWTMINPSPVLIRNHAEWYVINRLGQSTATHPPYVGYYNWLCPSRMEVRQYIASVVRALLQYELLAGVHFDYIRFPDVILPEGIQPKYNLKQTSEEPQYDYCYCDDCRQAFKERSGLDPLNIRSAAEQMEWRRFRENLITDIVKELAAEVQAAGKIASAAVFATPRLARKYVRQNWAEWPLDYIFPMIYHQFYNQPLEWIEEATRAGTSAIPKKRKLISGLFLSSIEPEQLKRALTLAEKGGAAGVSFFANNHLIKKPEYLKILQQL